MDTVIIKSITFLAIVLLGYVLTSKNFFSKQDSQVISKIVSRITLPCAILAGASTLSFTPMMMLVMSIAILTNLTMALLAKITFRHKSHLSRGSAMINTSGYNVGNITIPFVQSFFPGIGMSYVCMFDIGNALGWMGLCVAWGKAEADSKNKFSLLRLCKSLLTSIPFLMYIIIFALTIFNLTIPTSIQSLITTIANANSFLVMLMIGMMIDLHMHPEELKTVLKIIGLRMGGFITFTCLLLFFLPIPFFVKTILLLCIVPSAPSISIVFSKEIGDDSAIPAVVNSISLLLGIVCSTCILLCTV